MYLRVYSMSISCFDKDQSHIFHYIKTFSKNVVEISLVTYKFVTQRQTFNCAYIY